MPEKAAFFHYYSTFVPIPCEISGLALHEYDCLKRASGHNQQHASQMQQLRADGAQLQTQSMVSVAAACLTGRPARCPIIPAFECRAKERHRASFVVIPARPQP